MASLPVVKHLDPLEDGCLSLRAALRGALVNTLSFKRAEKALQHRIIVTIALPTHTHLDMKLGEHVLVGQARVVAAAVGVVEQLNSPLGCRLPSAIQSAASTRLSSRCAAIAQPTIKRE